MNPFDYVSSINKKEYMMSDEDKEKVYNSFLVNRALSYFPETILYTQKLNEYPDLDKKLQYDYLFAVVPKRPRFCKWAKKDITKEIECVKKYYKYTTEKAEQSLKILTKNQIEYIVNLYKNTDS